MKASEFGQSLLSDIRERNKEEQKRAEKRAKRDAWKQLGLKVAINVAEDVLQQRHQKLMNNETLMADKLKIDSVFEEANQFATKYQEAKDYEGGQDAYLRNELGGLIGTQLNNQYAPGTYSKSQFNSLKNSLVEGYFGKYKDAFESRAKAHKQFMIAGDRDRYYSNLKAMQGDGTIGSSLTQLIKKIPGVSKLTGNVNADLHKANQEILSSLKGEKGLSTYQEVYRKTKDTELSAYVAQNIKDIELGAPAPDYSERFEIEVPDGIGGMRKIQAQQQTIYGKDGTVKSVNLVQLTGKGYTSVSNEQLQGSIDFQTGAGLLKETQVNPGMMTLQKLSSKDSELVNKAQKDYLKEAGIKSTDSKYGDMLETRNELLSRTIAMSGLTAKNQGWGTSTVGREVAMHMILKDIEDESTGDSVITGLDNPFETAIAVAELLETRKIDPSTPALPTIMSNGVKLYQSFYGLDSKNKETIINKLEEFNYFDEYVNGKAVEDMVNVVRFAVANNMNPRDYGGTEEMLSFAQEYMEKNDIKMKQEKEKEEKERKAKEESKRLAVEKRMSAVKNQSLLFPPR